MSWIKKLEPDLLYQSSDIPFVISSQGAYLCFDNYYSKKRDNLEYCIAFNPGKIKTSRINAHLIKLNTFPIAIPFSNIYSINDKPIHLSKLASTPDSKKILLVKQSFLEHTDLPEDLLEEYDHVLVIEDTDNLNSNTDFVHIAHTGDLNRECVAIAHYACSSPDRNCIWINNVPEMRIDCYGIGIWERDRILQNFDNILPNPEVELILDAF